MPLHITMRGVAKPMSSTGPIGADGTERFDAVGREIEKRARRVGRPIERFEDRGLDAGPLQRHGDDRSADAASDDECVSLS